MNGYNILEPVACTLYDTSTNAYVAVRNRNVATTGTYTGVGDVTVTLGQEIDTTDLFATATVQGNTPLIVAVEAASDSTFRIRTTTHAGVAAEARVAVMFWRAIPLG